MKAKADGGAPQRHIQRILEVGIAVPNPKDTLRLLRDALEFAHTAGPKGTDYLSLEGEYGARPGNVLAIRSGQTLALEYVTLAVADEVSLKSIAEGLRSLGVAVEENPIQDGAAAIAFVDPAGTIIRCRTDEGSPGAALPPSSIRPRRLGHVNLAVPDASTAASFYTEALGFHLTERIGTFLYFLRLGSDHHNVGFRSGADSSALHHVAFEVPGWESFRVICDHLADRGYTVEYGPGRHAPGHNLFVYLRDPASGLRLELFADMAHIDDSESDEPIVWEASDRSKTVNRWGPAPPQSFLQ